MHESQPPPIIVSRPVARPRVHNNFWPGVFAGAVSVAALWLLASFAHFALVEDPAMRAQAAAESQFDEPKAGSVQYGPPPKEVLDREADAILTGRKKEWLAATWAGQQYACMLYVMSSHPAETRDRQRMLARLLWAQVDYVLADDELGSSFAETIGLIDHMDYQPKQPQRPKQ